ncbi:MAG: indolepyruvate ferredoxin oxidoreductase, beta subunit [Thermodesulfobacteriota bacterium]|nr:indolepyruvate ferredoxin oxidoreductase, beta subunit [Thermodesulfobacteriota bacterium]
MMNLLNLIITGVGGQGNVLASQILGQAAVKRGLCVTIGETFGLSQRGGAVMSHIRLCERGNYGPLIPPNMADVIVGLEPLETLRTVLEYGNEETVFIANSRPIHPLNVIAGDVEYPDPEWIRNILKKAGRRLYWLNATEKALDLGGPIMLNMIMLGALCALDHFPLTAEDIQGIIQTVFPASKLSANVKALEIGGNLIRSDEN